MNCTAVEGSSISISERTFVFVVYVVSISVFLKVIYFDFIARNLIRSLEFSLYRPNIYEYIYVYILVFLYVRNTLMTLRIFAWRLG